MRRGCTGGSGSPTALKMPKGVVQEVNVLKGTVLLLLLLPLLLLLLLLLLLAPCGGVHRSVSLRQQLDCERVAVHMHLNQGSTYVACHCQPRERRKTFEREHR